MWPAYEDADLNALGSVESNPNQQDATGIEISFGVYAGTNVVYPPFDKVLEKAALDTDGSDPSFHANVSIEIIRGPCT